MCVHVKHCARVCYLIVGNKLPCPRCIDAGSILCSVGQCYAFAGKGSLTYLNWNDMTCNDCGGKSDARCIQVTTGTDAQHTCGSKQWKLHKLSQTAAMTHFIPACCNCLYAMLSHQQLAVNTIACQASCKALFEALATCRL